MTPGRPLLLLKQARVEIGPFAARMAKLVDAPGLGPDARNGVGVRVPLLAPQVLLGLDFTYPVFNEEMKMALQIENLG